MILQFGNQNRAAETAKTLSEAKETIYYVFAQGDTYVVLHESKLSENNLKPDEALYSYRNGRKIYRSGTSPNTSLILSADELEYIERVWSGRKSAAIHEALKRLMSE